MKSYNLISRIRGERQYSKLYMVIEEDDYEVSESVFSGMRIGEDLQICSMLR